MCNIKKDSFTKEELTLAKKLAYENMEKEETDIGFVFGETWIANPFLECTGRAELTDLDTMYEYYGKENVNIFLNRILKADL